MDLLPLLSAIGIGANIVFTGYLKHHFDTKLAERSRDFSKRLEALKTVLSNSQLLFSKRFEMLTAVSEERGKVQAALMKAFYVHNKSRDGKAYRETLIGLLIKEHVFADDFLNKNEKIISPDVSSPLNGVYLVTRNYAYGSYSPPPGTDDDELAWLLQQANSVQTYLQSATDALAAYVARVTGESVAPDEEPLPEND